MHIVNNQHKAHTAMFSLMRNDRDMTRAMDRLSTGKRISSAKDDVGGFVMATTFEKDIRAAAQGAENTKHAIALLETVSSAANQAINILTRMKELAVQASTDGYTTGQRNNMNNDDYESESSNRSRRSHSSYKSHKHHKHDKHSKKSKKKRVKEIRYFSSSDSSSSSSDFP